MDAIMGTWPSCALLQQCCSWQVQVAGQGVHCHMVRHNQAELIQNFPLNYKFYIRARESYGDDNGKSAGTTERNR